MTFLFKNKKYVVDFFTANYSVFDNFKITEGRKFIPTWWKNLDTKQYDGNEKRPAAIVPTVKKCPGMIHTYKESFIMPLWTEIDIVMDENYEWTGATSDRKTHISTHSSRQYDGYLPKNHYTHLKIQSPWYAEEKTGVNFVVSPCSWDNSELLETYFIPVGIRSWKYTCSTNVHGFLQNKAQSINFQSGMPLVHFFPMTDKNVEVRCHYDPDKVERLGQNTTDRLAFSGGYFKKQAIARNR